ncbi:MAG: hypothetical protein CMJ75_16745 [Planctomycetaceae bacterium]|nr:hypothetical protein [Planctomycetaceae bacterium]
MSSPTATVLTKKQHPYWWPAVVVLLLSHPFGCERAQRSARTVKQKTTTALDASTRELKNALELLQDPNLTGQSPTAGKIAYGLNAWISKQPPFPNWQTAELTETLPTEVQRVLQRRARSKSQDFNIEDVAFLRETLWLRDVSSWVVKQKLDPVFERWLDGVREKLGDTTTTKLGIAHRLFDWTVRNIQLDPISPDFRDFVPKTPAEGSDQPPRPKHYAPRFGIPGPGYRFSAEQLLLYGHGDFWQRSWLFMLLARQQGIEVAMLAAPGINSKKPLPWCTAVLLDDRLFLFDTRLGLPIPNTNKRGVVQLAEVIRDPQILGTAKLPGLLDLNPQKRYPVRHANVQNVTAFIDGSPHYLSRRMRQLQEALTGDQRIVLATSTTDLATRLVRHQAIRQVQIWSIAYDAILYRLGRARTLSQDDRALRKNAYQAMGWPSDYDTLEKLLIRDYEFHDVVFQFSTSLASGRKQHLLGKFFKQEDELGAANYYLQARVSDRDLNNFLKDPRFRARQFGFPQRAGKNKNRGVELAHRGMQRAKQSATYWIGLANYDAGRFDVALDWLENRTLGAREESPWKVGARYNLGRTLEILGRVAEARRVYFGDDSAQSHGNTLRARWLVARQPESK